MTAGMFDDLIPPSPGGGAALTPADHAAFALQQRAMALQSAQDPSATGAPQPDPHAAFSSVAPVSQQPDVSFAAPAPKAGLFDDLIPRNAAPRAAGPLTFDEFAPPAAPAVPAARSAGPLTFEEFAPASQQAGDDDPLTAAPATWADTGAAIPKGAQYADDLVRMIANGATLGGADKIAGATISSPQQEAARTAAATQNTGTVGKVAGFAGAMAPIALTDGLVGAGAKALDGVPALGRLFGNPVARGATTGAAVGATDAATHGQDIAGGAGLGALGGAGGAGLGSSIGAGAKWAGGLFADAPSVMSSAEVQQAARQAYTDAFNSGVGFSPQAVQRLGGDIRSQMDEFGYAPELQPGGAAVARRVDSLDHTPTPEPAQPLPDDPFARAQEFARRQNAPSPEPAPVTPASLKDVDIARRVAGNMYAPTNPSQSALGGLFKNTIDDFTNNPRPGDIVMGDQGGIDALTQARVLYQRASKDQDLSDALSRAQDNAGASGSGGNINNATRQQVKTLQNSRRDWTPDEEAALTSIIRGTRAANVARLVGKVSPEGNGLMQAMNIGVVAAGGPHALAVPIAGALAKRYADAVTDNAVGNLGTLIRAGGNRATLQGAPNAVQRLGAAAPVPITNLSLGALYAPQEAR